MFSISSPWSWGLTGSVHRYFWVCPGPSLPIPRDHSPLSFSSVWVTYRSRWLELQQCLWLFIPPPFWCGGMSPEGERSSSSGEDKEKRRDSRLVRRREGREDEVAVRGQSPNTCTPPTPTKPLHHLEVTSPEDRDSLACIHVTSWLCFLIFPSTLLPQFCLHGFLKPIVPLSLSGKFEAASVHLVTPLMKCRSCAPVSSSRAPRGLVTFGCSLSTGAHALPFPNVQCHHGKLKFSAPKRGIEEVFLSVLCKNINDVFFCDLILRHSWTVSAEFSREFQPQAYIWPGKFQPKWLKFGKVYMHLKVVLIMESVRLF